MTVSRCLKELAVNTCELRVLGFDAARERGHIRWELFLHRDVRDVLLTPRSDALQVVHRGPAAPYAWSMTLREAGFPEPVFSTTDDATLTGGPPAAA